MRARANYIDLPRGSKLGLFCNGAKFDLILGLLLSPNGPSDAATDTGRPLLSCRRPCSSVALSSTSGTSKSSSGAPSDSSVKAVVAGVIGGVAANRTRALSLRRVGGFVFSGACGVTFSSIDGRGDSDFEGFVVKLSVVVGTTTVGRD